MQTKNSAKMLLLPPIILKVVVRAINRSQSLIVLCNFFLSFQPPKNADFKNFRGFVRTPRTPPHPTGLVTDHIPCCWLKFDNAQIFLATFSMLHDVLLFWPRSCFFFKRHPTCCDMEAKRIQYVVLNNVSIFYVEMLRAFLGPSQPDPTMLRYVGLKGHCHEDFYL